MKQLLITKNAPVNQTLQFSTEINIYSLTIFIAPSTGAEIVNIALTNCNLCGQIGIRIN